MISKVALQKNRSIHFDRYMQIRLESGYYKSDFVLFYVTCVLKHFFSFLSKCVAGVTFLIER